MTQIESEPRARQTPNGGRIPPSAIEAEECLIGAMLLSQEAVSIAYETVQAEDFYRPLHGQIFSSIIALANAGEPVDYVTVQAKLQERGCDRGRTRTAVVVADEHAVGGERAALRRSGAREGPAAPTDRGRRRDRRRRLRRDRRRRRTYRRGRAKDQRDRRRRSHRLRLAAAATAC